MAGPWFTLTGQSAHLLLAMEWLALPGPVVLGSSNIRVCSLGSPGAARLPLSPCSSSAPPGPLEASRAELSTESRLMSSLGVGGPFSRSLDWLIPWD